MILLLVWYMWIVTVEVMQHYIVYIQGHIELLGTLKMVMLPLFHCNMPYSWKYLQEFNLFGSNETISADYDSALPSHKSRIFSLTPSNTFMEFHFLVAFLRGSKLKDFEYYITTWHPIIIPCVCTRGKLIGSVVIIYRRCMHKNG